MQTGARGEAPRVAQELGIANIYVMQTGAMGEAPRVAQEFYITKHYITEALCHKNFVSLRKKFGAYAWDLRLGSTLVYSTLDRERIFFCVPNFGSRRNLFFVY